MKTKEINTFLKTLNKLYSQNPDFPITRDTIYNALSNYGKQGSIFAAPRVDFDFMNQENGFFKTWIEVFSNIKNISVFFHDGQRRFLQFRNPLTSDRDYYKLYLHFPKDKIKDAVIDIFYYMASNNINHLSKVADCIRSDDVVLRIVEEKDAIKVMNYINTNPYLFKSAKPVNPFLPTQGVVGMAYDKNLSYNATLSILLKEYFIIKRNTKTLNKVSIEDFKKFVYNLYNKIDNDFDAINSFITISDISHEFERLSDIPKEEVLLNYKKIIELIYKSLNPNFTTKEYFELMRIFKNNEYNKFELDKIEKILEPYYPNNKIKREDPIQLLNQYIVYGTMKYGINMLPLYIEKYLNGEERGITRDNNYRLRFTKSLPRELILRITNQDIQGYIDRILMNKSRNIFEQACDATLKKHGRFQLQAALEKGMIGLYDYFTNDGERYLRENMIRYISRRMLYYYCKEKLADMTLIVDKKVI